MRLTPIEKPKGILLKIAYFFSKREFGKVISALKFVYARSTPVMMVSYKIISTDKKLKLPKKTRYFIRYYTSHLNDCPFCSNAIEYMTDKENIELQHWKEFINFQSSEKFSDKEKALLSFLEEVNLTKSSTDKTFAKLKTHFSEKEIVEITWINSTENYFNLMAKPLGLTSDNLKVLGKSKE
jgi:alkylhydroperoxidase family enzyme